MLNEQVLEELVRSSPLQQRIVETAWPSLSTESRLQVIQVIQRQAFEGTPTWLMELCIGDSAPIVRYWAARHYSFESPNPSAALSAFRGPPADNEVKLHAAASTDENELVRACTSEDPWETGATVSRLVFARNKGSAHLITGLSKAFDAGLSDSELAEALREVLLKPDVQADLKFKGMYSDGDTAYYEGNLVSDGWALVRKAGPRVQRLLAAALPTDRGLAHITPAELATMPSEALIAMAYRPDKTKEISAALDLVLASPGQLEEKVIHSINDGIEACFSAEDGSVRAAEAVDRGQETLDQVRTLQSQVREVTEQLVALRQAANTKRSWF